MRERKHEAKMENMKKFMELISALDDEAMEKVSRMQKDELIAFAAEKGFTLTDADFQGVEGDAALSIDELAASSGGDVCGCAVGGGGAPDYNAGEKGCGCALIGGGKMSTSDELRCYCAIAGGGVHHGI